MDYNLAALKLRVKQLLNATPSESGIFAVGGRRFQRAWLQGVLVPGSDRGHVFLDDGSGVIELLHNEIDIWGMGSYVLVLGAYSMDADREQSFIKVHKIVDLSSSPNREALWNVEVIEVHQLGYSV